MTDALLELFAVTAPGLEEVTAGELRDLRARRVTARPGGVTFHGDIGLALRANLWLRTATRVLLRVSRFGAPSFEALVLGVARVDWPGLLGACHGEGLPAPVRVRASCGHSRLMHSGAVAERVAGVMGEALGLGPARRLASDRYGVGPVAQDEGRGTDSEADGAVAEGAVAEGAVANGAVANGAVANGAVANGAVANGAVANGAVPGAGHDLFVRVERDECTLSLDTSGESLHRRGYRLETVKAPLRETIAAALLRLAGWKGDCPLVDPLCGSGTLPIEAALIAARVPPGASRTFALEHLPGFDPAIRAAVDLEAVARRRVVGVSLRGSDRDEGAVRAARRNAERAGVAEEVAFECAPLGALCLASPPGLVATNPPYGRRLGEVTALRDLYATLGARVFAAPGWRLALVSEQPRLLDALGLPLMPLGHPVLHGGLRLHLVAGPARIEGAGASS